jgi:hypothetical protein
VLRSIALRSGLIMKVSSVQVRPARKKRALIDREVADLPGMTILVRFAGDLITYQGGSTPLPANLGLYDDGLASTPNETWIDSNDPTYYKASTGDYARAVAQNTICFGEAAGLYWPYQQCSSVDAYYAPLYLQSLNAIIYPQGIVTMWQYGGCLQRVFNKVGVRLVMTGAHVTGSLVQGQSMTVSLNILNDGYGRVLHNRPSALAFIQGSAIASVPLSWDLRTVSPGSAQTLTQTVTVPSSVQGGTRTSLAFVSADAASTLATDPSYNLPLNSADSAGQAVWNGATGSSRIMTVDGNKITD